jgi:hypothetical protein
MSLARSRACHADTVNAPDDLHPRANPKVSTAIRLDAHMEPEPHIGGNSAREDDRQHERARHHASFCIHANI